MAMKKEAVIQAVGISKRYRQGRESITALHEASLSIYKGELVAIVGPSGSGKTTLAHSIGGLITPDSGSIAIGGVPLKKRSDKVLSRYRNESVGFVFQNFGLIPHYTTLENVMMPLVVRGVSASERKTQAIQLLRLVGLIERLHQRASQLSGGERQRVAIARAIITNPAIIIADEPTGSLDSARGNEIMTIFETLNQKRGITILMVTHDERLASRADRVIHIRDGRIVKDTGR
jgi:putative ABC transport system ATP-binding protein